MGHASTPRRGRHPNGSGKCPPSRKIARMMTSGRHHLSKSRQHNRHAGQARSAATVQDCPLLDPFASMVRSGEDDGLADWLYRAKAIRLWRVLCSVAQSRWPEAACGQSSRSLRDSQKRKGRSQKRLRIVSIMSAKLSRSPVSGRAWIVSIISAAATSSSSVMHCGCAAAAMSSVRPQPA